MLYRRLLDPHIWESPSFNNLSRDARLLFIGLITSGDDEGYFRADSASLRRSIFGFDDMKKDDVILLLKEIQTKINSIHFFKEKNEAFGHFINWNKYQLLRKDRIIASLRPKCQPCENQLTTKRQPMVAKCPHKISKDKISKDKIRESKDKYLALDDITFKKELQDKFPNIPIEEEIEKMKDWLQSKGETRKDYAAFARNWLRKAKEPGGNGVVIVR